MAYAAPELSGPPAEPDGLSIELIRRRLAGGLVGGHIYLFGRIASTTEVLARLAEAGAREGTVVVAGDGMDLRLSALFRLAGALGEAPVLSVLTGRAAAEALRQTPLPAAVRIECATVAHRTDWAILWLNALDRLFATYAAGGASTVLAGWRENGGLDARE